MSQRQAVRLAFLCGVAGLACLAAPPAGKIAANGERSWLRIKLRPFFVPPVTTAGVLVRARVNGGPVLRLLLDSGSQYVVLSRRAAMKSGCSGGSNLDLIGAGTSALQQVKSLRAATVEVDGFVARDVPLIVKQDRLMDGIDGVAPLRLFAGYLIRLDLPGKSLDLLPYPDAGLEQPHDAPVLANNDLLFVKCRLNGMREGYFLLDTGASYTAISHQLARELNHTSLEPVVSLQGGVAPLEGRLVRVVTRLTFGGVELTPNSIVAVDLSQASRFHDLDIAGLLGYPSIRDRVIVVNYRDEQVWIESK